MLVMNLQLFAHKKGVGSSKNGRDSEAKRLFAKIDGVVKYERLGRDKKKASVYPVEVEEVVAE